MNQDDLPPYNHLLGLCLGGTLVLYLHNRRTSDSPGADKRDEEEEEHPKFTASFRHFRLKYLVVYLFMMFGDWLQGPYVYSLYATYGFSRQDIALLFVVGFAASMIVGTFVGSLADSNGRKKFCVLYAVLYIASCATKHFNNFYILMLGRLLGGVATSLLFSVFESWLVCECNSKAYGDHRLAEIFASQTLFNGLVAISSGILGQLASDALPMQELGYGSGVFVGGYTVPFDMASAAMFAGLVLCLATWEENYGERQLQVFNMASLTQGLYVLKTNRAVLCCGIVQSLFEGAMFSFVFEWSPALTPPGVSVPYGTIFATFMVACMFGSQMIKPVMRSGGGKRAQDVLPIVFLLSALGLCAVPVGSFWGTRNLALYGFLLFECMVGMYYPLMGMLKSQIVPEQHRSTLYNLFRIPLNAIVLCILLNKFTVSQTFQICVALLFVAAIVQWILNKELDRNAVKKVDSFQRKS